MECSAADTSSGRTPCCSTRTPLRAGIIYIVLASPFLLSGGAGWKVYKRIGRALSRKAGYGAALEESGADFFLGAPGCACMMRTGSRESSRAAQQRCTATVQLVVQAACTLPPLLLRRRPTPLRLPTRRTQACWSARGPLWWARASMMQVGGAAGPLVLHSSALPAAWFDHLPGGCPSAPPRLPPACPTPPPPVRPALPGWPVRDLCAPRRQHHPCRGRRVCAGCRRHPVPFRCALRPALLPAAHVAAVQPGPPNRPPACHAAGTAPCSAAISAVHSGWLVLGEPPRHN